VEEVQFPSTFLFRLLAKLNNSIIYKKTLCILLDEEILNFGTMKD
jgi:hypothetical protein